MAEYRDPIAQAIIDKFQAEGPAELKNKYYNGDVLVVPKEELPICAVAKDRTVIGPDSNMEDLHALPMAVTVIYDYTRDLDQSFDLQAGSAGLYKLVEGRGSHSSNNPYQLNSDSLAYILRKYASLDGAWDLRISVGENEVLDINYGLGVNRRGPGVFSVEAVMRFRASLSVPKPQYA